MAGTMPPAMPDAEMKPAAPISPMMGPKGTGQFQMAATR